MRSDVTTADAVRDYVNGQVRLCPTLSADVPALIAGQRADGVRQWLGEVSESWHKQILNDPSAEHLTVWVGDDLCGFVVLVGLDDLNGSIELRRIVVQDPYRGRGVGRQALTTALERAFRWHGAHRVWLDVKSDNEVARTLYTSVGLREEGTAVEALLEADGTRSSLVLLAVLRREWAPNDRDPAHEWHSATQ